MSSTREIRADLHNHFTHRSKILDPNKVADTVYAALGAGGICALVNYDDQRFEAFADQAEKAMPRATRIGNAVYAPDLDVLVVKGEEIPTQQGDLLVLGIEEGVHLKQHQPLEYSLKEAEEKGGMNVVVDPFLNLPFHKSKVGEEIKKNPSLLKYVPAIQVHSGIAPKKANKKAMQFFRWARRQPIGEYIGLLSCSDGHTFREVGSSATVLEVNKEYESLRNPGELVYMLQEAIPIPPVVPTVTWQKEDCTATKVCDVRSVQRKSSTLGSLEHMAVIGVMVLAEKVGIEIPRGDSAALRLA